MNGECKPEHILIRCKGCEQETCIVSCESDAVIYIRGDLLIEVSKCTACNKKAFPIPICITDCQNSGNKAVLEEASIEEKRKTAARILPLLKI